jgi:deazaflavin-dependent oxidoreductase (nitroreductase family)
MGKPYQVTGSVRFINRMTKLFIRLGLPPNRYYLLGVRGRTSGKLYETPVALVEQDGRWLVSPYGEVSWVKNARAVGQVTLTRGGRSETVTIEEVGADESAPILKTYIGLEAITREYFDAEPDSPVADFTAEADRHPVFRLISAAGG